MDDPFDPMSGAPPPAALTAEGEIGPILWIILVILALFGLLFGSLIYNETKGDSGSGPAPTSDHHHGPGGEEVPVFP